MPITEIAGVAIEMAAMVGEKVAETAAEVVCTSESIFPDFFGNLMNETVVGEKVVETAAEVVGKSESAFPNFFKNLLNENKTNVFNNVDSMKDELGKTYSDIKPCNSPNVEKWFDNGGTIKIEIIDGKMSWTYIDSAGKKVSYIDNFPIFPSEAKHSLIDDINIGKFTNDRNLDKKLYLQKMEEQYGLTEIPDGYALHHDSKNGNMQLIKTEWHKEFTHAGGHSLFKEG